MIQRAVKAAFWLLPVLALFWLYRDGLSTWFFLDDFAWLSLAHLVQVRHDLLYELFTPMAQGTIRPWSERAFFIVLRTLFGLDSLPFHLVVFATASANVILIAWITLRATGSRIAGFLAPILWAANTALVLPMVWSSAYNEIMCTLFLLSALALFIRYLETGRQVFWWAQLAVFILGFGALEINIVYPALAAAWLLFLPQPSLPPQPSGSVVAQALACGRGESRGRSFRTILPQAAISVIYFAIHRLIAPIPKSGPYVLHFNFDTLKTLALYCKWALVPEPIYRFGHSHHLATPVLIVEAIAIAAFVTAELRQRRYLVIFCLTWFAVTLAPMVPLTNHNTDYYITIPFIGIAILAGAAAGQYWNQPPTQRALMIIPIAAYLWAMIPVTLAVTHWWRVKSTGVRTLVLGVVAARQTHPGKGIALDGINRDLFDLSLAHSPFAAAQVDDVYLTPGSAVNIGSGTMNVDPLDMELDPDLMAHAVTHNDVVVYSLESDHLRNITEGFRRQLAGRTVDRLPTRVDVGNSLYSWLLGPSWLPPESGIRWMPGRATLRIGVPQAGTQLELEGRCPETQLLVAPRHLMVLVDGVVAGDTRIYDPESNFHRLIPVPALLTGKTSVEIEIRVDPVDRKDGQDYGLVFGKFAIRP